jgi:hypothetical protein
MEQIFSSGPDHGRETTTPGQRSQKPAVQLVQPANRGFRGVLSDTGEFRLASQAFFSGTLFLLLGSRGRLP